MEAVKKNHTGRNVLLIIGIILLVLIVVAVCIYKFVLNYPNLNSNPKEGKWYRITSENLVSSDGSSYRAFFKKGSENKVMIYFAGGGVSVSEETAKEDMYNKKVIGIDMIANITMNMGGLATAVDGNPFKDWTVIAFPYATGDFHAGTNDFKYTDKDGKEKTLYHHGYTNYTYVMKKALELGGIKDAEAVIVTGYSAGAAAASLLANDVFTNYFPNAQSKTVLVDAMLLLKDDWHDIASDVWKAPSSITDRLTTNNFVLDSLSALRTDWGNSVNILFDCSTRDGDLAKVQNYFDTGKMEVDEEVADIFQQNLKDSIPVFKAIGAYLYIWDGIAWYDDPRNLTLHTIIATPYVFGDQNENGVSIAEWAMNAVQGQYADYGLDLVNKVYEKTE